MQTSDHTPAFWFGNLLLGMALVMLLFLGSLWEIMGSWSMGLWMLLAGAGFYLVTRGKGPSAPTLD
jgi:hypothetical protein